jgi:membrane protease YdiL (CAAX protease family)
MHIDFMELSKLSPEDFSKRKHAGVAKGLLVVQFFGIFLIPSLLFGWLADAHPFDFVGIKMPDRLSSIFLGILIILFSYLMVEWTASINQDLVRTLFGKSAQKWIEEGESNVNGTLQNILDMKNSKDLLVSIVLVGLLAVIGEEIFFRGILHIIMILIFC